MKSRQTFKEFFWSMAGFQKHIIATASVDRFYASIIGVVLLLVGIYAALAWTFFFQSVTTNVVVPVVGGLFMGFFIFSFDRAMIASMSTGNSKWFAVVFRLMLATLLGVFLAQPMILKFYQSDINREAQLLLDVKNQVRKAELQNIYTYDLEQLTLQKSELTQSVNDKQNLLSQTEFDFKKEMDGSAGTGKWGYNTVAKRKEQILNQHQKEYGELLQLTQPKIEQIQKDIDEINTKVLTDFELYKVENKTFGTLIQVEALQSLLTKDKTGSLRLRYYLLVIILTLIELSALIAKMMFRMESYSAKVRYVIDEEVAMVMVKRQENSLILDRNKVLTATADYRKSLIVE